MKILTIGAKILIFTAQILEIQILSMLIIQILNNPGCDFQFIIVIAINASVKIKKKLIDFLKKLL